MNSKITLNLPKAFLFNFWMCIGVYVSGQTSNSEFNAFLKEKQSSSADEKSTPQNLLERPLDSVIRDIIIPEWNFKEHLSKLDTVLGHTPVTIEMKRTISKSTVIEQRIDGELLKIELLKREYQIPVAVKLYDMYGNVFYNTTIYTSVSIEIELYPPGTYILYASSSETINQFVKIVIQ